MLLESMGNIYCMLTALDMTVLRSLLLLLHQFSLRAHFQISININKYIIESEARTVRRLTKSDIEKVCLESLPEMSYEGDDVMSDGRLFQIIGAQRLTEGVGTNDQCSVE